MRRLVLARPRPDLEAHALEIHGYPEIPVLFFQNRKLSHAAAEHANFEVNGGGFKLSPAWPDAAAGGAALTASSPTDTR